jgi:hypothetical protein
VVALSPEAGADPRWCAEFADLVARDGTALGPMDSTIHETDLYGPRPWAASYPEPGRRGAERLLTHLPGAIPEGTDPGGLLPSSGILNALNGGGQPATPGPFAPFAADQPTPGPFAPQQQEQYPDPFPSPYARPPAGTPTSGPAYSPAPPAAAPQPVAPQPAYQQTSAPPSYRPPASPPPSYPPPPSGSRGGRGGLITAIVAGVLVVGFLAVLGGVGIYKAVTSPDDKPTAQPSRSSNPTPSPTPPPTSEPTPTASTSAAPPAGEAEPTLKSVPAVSVVGPTWSAGDPTYTMAFRGWPFAFRVPKNFGCLKASNPPPGGIAWVCTAESAGPKGRIAVIYRPCATGCSAAEQTKLDQDWLDASVTYRARDAATRYHEKTVGGQYELTFSHYFGAGPGQPLKYQVAAYASSTPADKPSMQKTVNDLRSQTP